MGLKFQISRNDIFFPCNPKPFKHKSGKRKKFVGVRQRPSGKWVAEIKNTTQQIRLWLGTFDTAEAAARAYDEAACLLRGSNTRKNFIDNSPSTSPISSKITSLLNKNKASRQNLTFTPSSPTKKTTNKTSSQKSRQVLLMGLNQALNTINEEVPMYNFSFNPPKTVTETSSPQSYSESTSPATSEETYKDLFDDDVYRPDLSQCLDGEENMDILKFGQVFGDDFYHFSYTNEDLLATENDLLASEMSENRFQEFEHMKVERQISASLYAMNGINEYWQNLEMYCSS